MSPGHVSDQHPRVAEESEEALAAALTRVAEVPRLLVASDYDGVLAPIVTDPAAAHPLPGAVAALRALAALPDTAVAAVSGRARDDLARVSGLPPQEVMLVGSHGAELAGGLALDEHQRAAHTRLTRALREIVDAAPGTRLETKPASVVLHTRTAGRDVAGRAVTAALTGPATWEGVHVTRGKEVVELAVVTVHKGTALGALRARAGADAVVFFGDDVTDENAFAVLTAQDVGVKVGAGQTRAGFRVTDPPAAVRALALLRERRTAHAR